MKKGLIAAFQVAFLAVRLWSGEEKGCKTHQIMMEVVEHS